MRIIALKKLTKIFELTVEFDAVKNIEQFEIVAIIIESEISKSIFFKALFSNLVPNPV